MRINTSYYNILSISVPIMLGSAVQNVIALIDSLFLYRVSEIDFAAIGFVGVFYLLITVIGFGISRGGQIIMARRNGEEQFSSVGRTFRALVFFELILAICMFVFMQLLAPTFFSWFVNSDAVLSKSIEYLEYRSYGVFFSYLGLVIIAFYSGIARTGFIIIDTILLAGLNIVLDYGLVFGEFGFKEMGIAGAGLASTLAEVGAFIIFLIYLFWDKKIVKYQINRLEKISFDLIKSISVISFPIVAQLFLAIGSWFVFFSIIENMGEKSLAITNLTRIVYLILSVPVWGFASGINTLVSQFIGSEKRIAVMPIIRKTANISLALTLTISLPTLLLPEFFLYPLFGAENSTLISDSRFILYILIGILAVFSVGAIYFNGLLGTGLTQKSLALQAYGTLVYIAYVFIIIHWSDASLHWAWAGEIVYWLLIWILSYTTLSKKKWYYQQV